MVRQPYEPLDAQKSVPLKLAEPMVDSKNPWTDDLLARQDIAARLTNLVATQEPPLTISLHGKWGTGKTFLLKRWQRALERENFHAIYFNAWEDDFCDDPLLAILGQLADYFTDEPLRDLAKHVTESALPLVRSNVSSVLNHLTGLTTNYERERATQSDLFKEYLAQRNTKDRLRDNLQKLAAKVQTESTHPLIFIVDELDRCRPTFTIELLERVKHIFDVHNLVFVFGLNRAELSKSLSSVYGNINTDVYLRRFFDFEFNLPEAGSQRFAEHLIDRFQLGQVFQSLSAASSNQGPIHDYENYRTIIPSLWSALGLSLRDIDYGIRILALLARNVPLRTFTHPFLVAVLITMKFNKPEFYHSLVTGDFRASEIVDYIDEESKQSLADSALSSYLDRIEGFLYCADNANREPQERGEAALAEIGQVADGPPETDFLIISRRAQNADQGQLQGIRQAIEDGRRLYIDGKAIGNLAALIDTYQPELRR